jgi:PAS domain S-box-containing protein
MNTWGGKTNPGLLSAAGSLSASVQSTLKTSKQYYDQCCGKMAQPTRKNRNRVAGIAFVSAAVLTLVMALRARHETIVKLGETQAINDAIQAMLDNYDIGYAIMDERQQVIEWNPALERLSGWTKDEVKEHGLKPLMDEDSWRKHQAAFANAMQGGQIDRTVVVSCQIPDHRGASGVPVRITVRIVKSRNANLYAIAYVDRESKVIEITPEAK